MPLDLEGSPLTTIAGGPPIEPSPIRPIQVLTYVHLRNIHGSTGAGRVARQMTEHLAQRNDIALHILADKSDRDRIVPLVGGPWSRFEYHTFESDTSRQQARWYILNTPKAESFWPNAEIAYCAGESYVPTTKARLVVTAHDAAYFERGAHPEGSSFWRQRLKWKLLFGRLASRVDMIHTVSHFSSDRLAHFFPSLASRIRVVPNAVTPRFFEPVCSSGLAFLDRNELRERTYILIPGGLSFRKNARLILEVAPLLLARYPKLKLVVSGHNDPTYLSSLRQLRLPVVLLGFVEDAALHALYTNALAVWFPSQYEGFGMPVLEAMASGAPVVASQSSSIPEIAGEAALLAAPCDAGQHLELLAALIQDESLREQICRLGKARASLFTWPKSAETLTGYFKEIL